MLERILFYLYFLLSPVLLLARLTRSSVIKPLYWVLIALTLVPILMVIYGVGLLYSYIAWKLTTFMWWRLKLFGYDFYNRSSIHLQSMQLQGTSVHHSYFTTTLPHELNFRWRRDKVLYNYTLSIIRAYFDYIHVPLQQVAPIQVIDDRRLQEFVVTSQIALYLREREGRLVFDMRDLTRRSIHANTYFETVELNFEPQAGAASLAIVFADGSVVRPGDRDWAMAKTYFLANAFAFLILYTHLHHHLFFPEIGALFAYNFRAGSGTFGKLIRHHAAYCINLNQAFRTTPLSMRETTGTVDKYLYTCAGHVTGETFYSSGYANALYMYYQRETEPTPYTQVHEIEFGLPPRDYVEGPHPYQALLRKLYDATRSFVAQVVPVIRASESNHVLERWALEMIRYFGWERARFDEQREAFLIDLLATYIWHVSFVHSLEHSWFYRLMPHFSLFCRQPFARARRREVDEVFAPYDLWKTRHIIKTFGRNNFNPGIIEHYVDMDYEFDEPELVAAQEVFKSRVCDILESYDVDPKSIAPSIRF